MAEHGQKPLDGVRVVELSQAIAAPTCGRYLSSLGAEVIKVENLHAPDMIRASPASWLPPETNPVVKLDVSPLGEEYASGRMSVGMNITHPKGRPLLEELVKRSDVFMINYSANAISNLGLAAEDIVALKDDIVYISLPGFGSDADAPYFTYKAWGPNQAPIAGIDHMTGWPDRPAAGLGSFSYPDFLGGMQAAMSIISAILRRDATGRAQVVDLSQYETAVAAIGPVMMDYFANGVSQGRTGNRVPWAAPQGSYPAMGKERWVAISCTEDSHWDALCQVASSEAFTEDGRFTTASGRTRHADELDGAISRWTARHFSRDLVYRLQRAGCPAGVVSDQADMLVDPQLESRRAFAVAPHGRLGKDLSVEFPVHFSESPVAVPRGGMVIGEDNEFVYEGLLGLSKEERAALAAEGAIFEVTEPETTFTAPYVGWTRHLWRDGWSTP